MGKVNLAESIRSIVGDASIASMVSNSGTGGREQIEYLPRTSLVPDERNFYSLDGIDELAANIETIGIQQPLRVRPLEDDPELYRIVSGHRRRAALDRLALAGNHDFDLVPCIVERDNASPALRELRLIYANSDTRRMSDAELAQQIERVADLLFRLKEEGYVFPGRMRNHVAEACRVSKTKVATLQQIQGHLIPKLRKLWDGKVLNTDKALCLSQASQEEQERIADTFGADALQALTKADVQGEVEALRHSAAPAVRGDAPEAATDPRLDADERHRELIYTCRKYLLPHMSPSLVFTETRRGGIDCLKRAFGAHRSFDGRDGFLVEFSPGKVRVRPANCGHRRQSSFDVTWTELWDALAVAALQEWGLRFDKEGRR